MEFVSVAVPGAGALLTYRVPSDMGLARGDVVVVSVRQTQFTGLVLGPDEAFPGARMVSGKSGLRVPEELVDLGLWIADYYLAPVPEALRLVMPPGVPSREKIQVRMLRDPPAVRVRGHVQRQIFAYLWERRGRWMSLERMVKSFGPTTRPFLERMIRRGACQIRSIPPRAQGTEAEEFVSGAEMGLLPASPTDQQARALEELLPMLDEDGFRAGLIHGATGSGKTAVYAWLARHCVQRGHGAIILVPEISLTPQTARVFRDALGERVAVYHSAFSKKERMWLWEQVASGAKDVVLGPRSALFLPVRNLGLVVVDEEHDNSYKSSRLPYYNARDIAAVRAQHHKALLILGSATPSAESYHNALRGKYKLIPMPRRVPGYPRPRVRVVDMREEEVSGAFSLTLLDALRDTVASGHQAILFLNRRGYAPFVQCLRCGAVIECPDCSVSMTFHKDPGLLVCHLCGKTARFPEVCPSCGSARLQPMRYGVQRVEENLRRLMPGVEILRLDRDITQRKHGAARVLDRFASGRAKVLIGTRLVTHGLDFPGVRLVGVLFADQGLFMPDFRAEEHQFQLLTQVTGRLRSRGTVMIQTYMPGERAIKYALSGDYEAFIREELSERRRYGYPPFARLVLVEAASKDRSDALAFLEDIKARVVEQGLVALGPSPAPHERVAGVYRMRLLLKIGQTASRAVPFLRDLCPPSGLRLRVDVDPVDMM